MLPLVDESGNVIGKAKRAECHDGTKMLHPVVHLHVRDAQGRLMLQLRAKHKKIQPGKWDTAVGGHVDFGECVSEALRREVREEIGLIGFTPEMVDAYVFESDIEREYVNVFVTEVNSEFCPDVSEEDVADARFFTLAEIREMIGRGDTTPNFTSEFTKYFAHDAE